MAIRKPLILKRLHQAYQKARVEALLESVLAVPAHKGPPTLDLEIHMLTCRAHLHLTLWAIRSFIWASKACPEIVLHDDGSLSELDVSTLQDAFPYCQVIRRNESDLAMSQRLADFPWCRKFRASYVMALKLFDFMLIGSNPNKLFMDTDILFFGHPSQLLPSSSRSPMVYYMQQFKSSYSWEPFELEKFLGGRTLLPCVNAGLVSLNDSGFFDLPFLESYAEFVLGQALNDLQQHFTEQTAYALLFSRAHTPCLPLGENYRFSEYVPGTTACHYVNNGTRIQGLDRDLPRLMSSLGVPAPRTLKIVEKFFFRAMRWCYSVYQRLSRRNRETKLGRTR